MTKAYNNFKTALLLGLMTGLILFVGSLFGQGAFIVACVLAVVMNFVSYFFSDKIALMSMRAQQVGPDNELYRIVEPLARRANLPMPRVYVSPAAAAPNAFATGRNPRNAAVCATAGLMQVLDRDEIAGVMAHELAHVKHRDILIASVAATIAGVISALGTMFWFGGARDQDGDSNPLAGLVALIVAPLAAGLIQASISRSREFNADKEGAEICGDAMPLATALEKIHAMAHQVPLPVNPAMNGMFIAEPFNGLRRARSLFQTHPPLEQRLINLIGRESTGRIGYGQAAPRREPAFF